MPDMSVIVLTPDNYADIRLLMAHLCAQTVRDRLEIVLVAPERDRLQADEAELAGFGALQIIQSPVLRSTSEARAAGVRAATAPIVVFTEDHSFPEPAWAESLIRAHAEAWAAVGPAVRNANPRTALSWANLLIEYIEWLEPTPSGPVPRLPSHHSAYKRDVLLQYGTALGEWLEVESVIHSDLIAYGHRLYVQSEACTRHLNYSRLSASIPLRFWSGRVFAAKRRHAWSLPRRLLYICGAPLIPLVRLARIVRALQSPGRRVPKLARVLAFTALLLAVNSAGECVGYALDAGSASLRLVDMDFHRERFLCEADRLDLAAGLAAPAQLEGNP